MKIKKILERVLGKTVHITLTNNRANIISFSRQRGQILLRLQRIFNEAPLDVVYEIAELIEKPAIKTPLINEFFRRNQWRIRKRPRVINRIEPVGRVYNLVQIFNKLNREYFSDSLDAVITWGNRSPKRSVRKRTLGSYNAEARTIRINPILDSLRVPRFFIEYVVYHEMLHAHIGISRRKNGRLAIHTREFKEMERGFRYFEKATEWEKRFV